MSPRALHASIMVEPLFVGATRPAMRWGVTYSALLCNLVLTMELFLASRNLCMLVSCIPLHVLCATMCMRDPRYFDLVLLWLRLRLPRLPGNRGYWGGSSYSPMPVSLPDAKGRRPRRAAASEEYQYPIIGDGR